MSTTASFALYRVHRTTNPRARFLATSTLRYLKTRTVHSNTSIRIALMSTATRATTTVEERKAVHEKRPAHHLNDTETRFTNPWPSFRCVSCSPPHSAGTPAHRHLAQESNIWPVPSCEFLSSRRGGEQGNHAMGHCSTIRCGQNSAFASRALRPRAFLRGVRLPTRDPNHVQVKLMTIFLPFTVLLGPTQKRPEAPSRPLLAHPLAHPRLGRRVRCERPQGNMARVRVFSLSRRAP